jgi:hypothetical protein
MKVKDLIFLLSQMNPEKEVVQEGDEWCDVGFCFEKYYLYPTRDVDEEADRVILRRS